MIIRNLVEPDWTNSDNITKDKLVPIKRYFEWDDASRRPDEFKEKTIKSLKNKLKQLFSGSPNNIAEFDGVIKKLQLKCNSLS